MTETMDNTERRPALTPPPSEPPLPVGPVFILNLDEPAYGEAMRQLAVWVKYLLMPIYGQEVSSGAPWCSRWWEHPEAVVQLHALWMAWEHYTSPMAGPTGPATWHRDYLSGVMALLRDPLGPFDGCKAGTHRSKDSPQVDDYPDTPVDKS
jgi:hypothetical protein